MDYLDTLSRFAAELDFASQPLAVREQTSWVLADTLASIVGGSAEPELRALAGRGIDVPGTHHPQGRRERGLLEHPPTDHPQSDDRQPHRPHDGFRRR